MECGILGSLGHTPKSSRCIVLCTVVSYAMLRNLIASFHGLGG